MRRGRSTGTFASSFLLILAAVPSMLGDAQTAQSGWQLIGQIGGPTQAVAVQGNYSYFAFGCNRHEKSNLYLECSADGDLVPAVGQ